MDVQSRSTSPTVTEVTVTLAPEAVEAAFVACTRRLLKTLAVPGFRPGHAPRAMVERRYAAQIGEAVRQQLFEQSLSPALVHSGVPAIGTPRVTSVGRVARGAMFVYAVACEVLPKFTLTAIEGLEAQIPPAMVADEDVDQSLEARRGEQAHMEPVQGRSQVEHGDWVLMDFVTTYEGRTLAEPRAKGLWVDTTDPTLVPELAQAVVGAQVPGSCVVALTLPADFANRRLAGREVQMVASLLEIKVRVLPPLDDALALDLGAASLAALRESTRAELAAARGREQEQKREEAVLAAFTAAHPIDVPAGLVDDELKDMLEAAGRHLRASRGIAAPGGILNDAGLRERFRADAEKRVRQSILLSELVRARSIEVDEQSLERAVDKQVAEAGDDAARARAHFADPDHRRGLHAMLLHQAALAHLVAHARTTERVPDGEREPAGEIAG